MHHSFELTFHFLQYEICIKHSRLADAVKTTTSLIGCAIFLICRRLRYLRHSLPKIKVAPILVFIQFLADLLASPLMTVFSKLFAALLTLLLFFCSLSRFAPLHNNLRFLRRWRPRIWRQVGTMPRGYDLLSDCDMYIINNILLVHSIFSPLFKTF